MVLSRIKDKIDNTLVPYLPMIRARIGEAAAAMGGKARELAGDDDKLRRVLRTVHAQLPFAVRIAVKQQSFVEFCMRNKVRMGIVDDRQGPRGDGES